MAHQSGDSLPRNLVTSGAQLRVHPRATVLPPARVKRCANVSSERLVALGALRRRPTTPGVVLSIKSECLSKLVPLGERHLRLAISEFVEHYHLERNHQGLDNRLITTVAVVANENADPAAPVARRERLGGILNYYYRRAA